MNFHARALVRVGTTLALATMTLALAAGAGAGLGIPVIKLDTVLVQQGKAVVSGSLDVAETVQINGVQVAPDASGDFDVVVDLNGTTGGILLSLLGGYDERIVVNVPLGLLSEGVSVSGLLDNLLRAGTTIDVPSDGFVTLDGTAPLVSGRVLDRDRLASLSINGREILAILGPNGAFSVIPPSNPGGTVVVTATDTRGVSQTSTFTTRRVTSTIGTRAGLSVSAAGALGVRITSVRLDKSRLRSNRLMQVALTVRDRRGLLVRGAAVRLRGEPGRYLVNGPTRAGFTNKLGKAVFTVTYKREAFATAASRRVGLLVNASTPRAAAQRRVPVLLPKLAPR